MKTIDSWMDLRPYGIDVSFGQDCCMDPWYSMGSADMLDVAHMGLHVAQLTGRELEISGNCPAALKATIKSLAIALRLGMPYEEALARRQLARLLPNADLRKSDEIKQALDLFSRLASQGEFAATAQWANRLS